MGNITEDDNIYKVGAIVTAKVDPDLSLIIVRYYQRIYYCSVATEPERKYFAYFERELNPPSSI